MCCETGGTEWQLSYPLYEPLEIKAAQGMTQDQFSLTAMLLSV